MASLTGTKIKDTYDSLLKVSDNGALGASAKQITDGLGNSSGVYLGTSGDVGIGIVPDALLSVGANLNNSVSFAYDFNVRGAMIHGIGSGDANMWLHRDDVTISADNVLGTIHFSGADGGSYVGASIEGVASANWSAGSAAGYLSFNTSSTADTSPTERMRIDSSGHIDINGGNIILRNSSLYAPASGYLKDGFIANDDGNLEFAINGASNAAYGTMSFITRKGDSSDPIEAMRIDSSGNVDINGGGYLRVSPSTPPSMQLYRNVNLGNNASAGSLNFGGADTSVFAAGAVVGATTEGVWSSSSHPTRLYFATTASGSSTATERMRITSGGYLKASNEGYYASSTGVYHEINSSNTDDVVRFTSSHLTDPRGIRINFRDADPNNTSTYFLRCSSTGGVTRMYIYSNGNLVNSNNSYGGISDAKLKENIVDASPKLDDLMQVQVRNFNYIGDDKKQLGVVAQELETIFPNMIDETPDFEEREVELRDENGEIIYETEQVLVSEAIAEELDADGNVITPSQEAVYETVTTDVPVMTTEKFDLGTTTKSVKYSVFVPMLIKAIQELKAEVDALKGA